MNDKVKYLFLFFLSVLIAKLLTLVFFILRFWADSHGMTLNFAGILAITDFIVPLLTGFCSYLIAKRMKLKHQLKISIAIFLLWLILLIIF